MSLEIIKRPVKFLYEDNSSFTNFKYVNQNTDAYFESTSLSLSQDDITFVFWFSVSDLSTNNNLINLYDSSESVDTYVFVDSVDSRLKYTDNSGTIQIDPTAIEVDTTYQVIIRNQFGSLFAYVNGVEVLSGVSVDAPNYSALDSFRLLQNQASINSNSNIDEAYIFSGTVDVNQLYNNGEKLDKDFIRTTRGVLHYWQNRVDINNELEDLRGSDNLTVNGTPEEVNYSSKGLFETSDVISTWNAIGGELPVRYNFESDLFPTNNADSSINVGSVQEFQGRLRVNCNSAHGLFRGNYVTHSGFTVDSYDGVHRITSIIDANSYVIDIVFDSNSTGQTIKYYKDYRVSVDVYAGLPDYHVLNSDFPMQKIGTVAITPDLSNVAEVDITGLAKTFLRENNDLFTGYAPLDYESFISFYVEYQEIYQDANSNGIFTFEGDLEKDTIGGCIVDEELFDNSNFASGLAGWSQQVVGKSWVVGAGDTVEANKVTEANTAILFQDINLEKGVSYTIKVDIVAPNNTNLTISGRTTGGLTKTILTSITSTTEFEFVADTAYDRLSIIGYYQVQGQAYDGDISLNEFSCKVQDCTTYLWGSNSVQQFQYFLGGNMGEYLVIPNNEAKFLSDFEELVYFRGKEFTVSTILSNNAFTNSYNSDNVYFRMTVGLNSVDRKVKNMNDGLYMIGNQNNENLIESMIEELEALGGEFDKATIEVYSVPENKFVDCNFGNFNTTDDEFGNPPSDWNVTRLSYVDPVTRQVDNNTFNFQSIISNPSQEGYGSCVFDFSSGPLLTGFNKVSLFNTVITLEPNSEYTVSAYFNDDLYGYDPQLIDNIAFLLFPTGLPLNQLVATDFTRVGNSSGWYKNSLTFNTENQTNWSFELTTFLYSDIAGTGGAWGLDNIEVLGPYERLTEQKTLCINNDCANQEIYLTWLNSLGGREYWNFTSLKDYGERTSATQIKRNIYNNWDSDFIEGTTENDYTSVQSNRVDTVRSQLLTQEKAESIWGIKNSLRVQVIDGEKLTTVLVDKGSFQKYRDRDNLYAVEFKISYPDTQIQNQ